MRASVAGVWGSLAPITHPIGAPAAEARASFFGPLPILRPGRITGSVSSPDGSREWFSSWPSPSGYEAVSRFARGEHSLAGHVPGSSRLCSLTRPRMLWLISSPARPRVFLPCSFRPAR
jgi:hypothetical protein